jgi:hypothetical protein
VSVCVCLEGVRREREREFFSLCFQRPSGRPTVDTRVTVLCVAQGVVADVGSKSFGRRFFLRLLSLSPPPLPLLYSDN